MKENLG